MTIDLTQLALLGILCSAVHWLLGRSEIARPFWSRATGWLAKLLSCPACSGFWLGAYFGGLMVPVLTFPTPHTPRETILWWFWRFFIPGLLGVFVTPVFEGLLVWGLNESAIVVEDTGPIPQSVAQSDSEANTPTGQHT
jgi:hypothetical protein